MVVDHEGNLYFSHDKFVTKVTPDGKATTWAATGSPNGHKVLADGSHLICYASRHFLLHLDAAGNELRPAATESDGKPLRSPNDLTLDPSSGGVYFTDPADSNAEHPDGAIHYTTGGEPGALFRLDLPGVKGLTILPPRSVKKGPQPARAKQVN